MHTDNDQRAPFSVDRHSYVLGPVHPLLQICTLMRNEAWPIYYSSKPARFHTLGDLGTALLLLPNATATLKHVQISRIRASPSIPGYGLNYAIQHGVGTKDTRIEPGLAMLAKLPELERLGLEIGTLPGSSGSKASIDTLAAVEAVLMELPTLKKLKILEVRGSAFVKPLNKNARRVEFCRKLERKDEEWVGKSTTVQDWHERVVFVG